MECSQFLNTFKYYSVSINRKLDSAEELKQSFTNHSSANVFLSLYYINTQLLELQLFQPLATVQVTSTLLSFSTLCLPV